MTASGALDGRIDWFGTYAQLVAAQGASAGNPVGTQAWTTDQGEVHWNGSKWIQLPVTDGIVAHAGGTQAAAVLLVAAMNRIITVGTAGDSVALPVSYPSAVITITNSAAANALNVFPNIGGTGTEAINALGANAAFSLTAAKSVDFICYTAGQWFTNPLVP